MAQVTHQGAGQVAGAATIQVCDGKSTLRLGEKLPTGLHQDEFNFMTLAREFMGEIKVNPLGPASSQVGKKDAY